MGFNLYGAFYFCNFPFLCDVGPSQSELNTIKYDFIVVGAGSAGSIVASRLSENPKVNVLLLEAGGCPPFLSEVPAGVIKLVGTDFDWNYKAKAQNNAFLAYPERQPLYHRGKMLGGSSSLSAMMYLPGMKPDFDQWGEMGLDGWSYDEVMKYNSKLEGNNLGDEDTPHSNGPVTLSYPDVQSKAAIAFMEAAKQMGFPQTGLNSLNQTGFKRQVFSIRDGARCSTAKAYLVPAQFRTNLKIVCNARVTKILFNANNETVGVTFTHDKNNYTASTSKEVIISAGAFNSPQLLMLSGIGPVDQLQKFNISPVAILPGVGQNLQDHYGTNGLVFKVDDNDAAFQESQFYNLIDWANWRYNGNGMLTLPLGVEVNGCANTKYADPSGDWPDVQFLLISVLPIDEISNLYGVSKEILEAYLKPLGNGPRIAILVYLMRPDSSGTVTLQSGNPFADPVIDLNYFGDPRDMRTLVEGMKLALKLGNSSAMKSLGAEFNPAVFPGCENNTFLSDEYLECLARHMTIVYFHASGTCKMGVANDTMAVVDNNFNVYGVKKLRVVDASAMPMIVSVNTNGPVMMMAEKAADAIKALYAI